MEACVRKTTAVVTVAALLGILPLPAGAVQPGDECPVDLVVAAIAALNGTNQMREAGVDIQDYEGTVTVLTSAEIVCSGEALLGDGTSAHGTISVVATHGGRASRVEWRRQSVAGGQ
jgi:hypothetical protein